MERFLRKEPFPHADLAWNLNPGVLRLGYLFQGSFCCIRATQPAVLLWMPGSHGHCICLGLYGT